MQTQLEFVEKESWKWLLSLGGFKYERGKKPSQKSSQGKSKNTPILSCSKEKIAEIEVSP